MENPNVSSNIAIFTATKGNNWHFPLAQTALKLNLDEFIHPKFNNRQGLAKVYNECLDIAIKEKFEYVMFIHDDVHLEHDPRPKLEKLFQEFDIVGVAGCSKAEIKSPALWHLMGGGWEGGMEGLDKSGTSNVAAKMKRTKEDIYERPLEDIYRIQAQAAPLVKLINRLMRKKRSKKGEVWAIDDEKATPEVHLAKELAEELSYILPFTNKEFQDSSSDTENRGGSLFAKREMSNEKSTNPRKYFGKKFTQPEIDQLIKFLESREESGLGITEAQWTNLISKMKTSNPLISELGEYLLGVTQREKEQNIDESGEFEGYDKESLAQVLDTPEKEDIFRSHYELKQAEADRQSEIEEKRFTAGLKKYERYQQSASGSGIEAQIEKLMLKAEESDNPSEIKQIKRKIEALLKKRDEPEDEKGVMGYMTEQVNKDKHLNNIGEYKDRGFKKPVNYNHWMMLNS